MNFETVDRRPKMASDQNFPNINSTPTIGSHAKVLQCGSISWPTLGPNPKLVEWRSNSVLQKLVTVDAFKFSTPAFDLSFAQWRMASLQQLNEENDTSSEVAQVNEVIGTTESQKSCFNLSTWEFTGTFLAKIKKLLFILWQNIVGIKSFNEESVMQHRRGYQLERVRLYHVWPGNNVFFLKGLLICGPDPRGLLLTIVSISLSCWVFSLYVANDISKYSNIIVSFCVLLALIVLANLILVSIIDPGIILRNDEPPSTESTKNGKIKSKRIMINGLELKLKYCRICNIFRPPRSCHCVVCDNCVEKFDHHCPWIGQCIGLRNYRLYVMLLVMASVYFVYIFAFSCQKIQDKNGAGNSMGLIGLVKDCPETLALACFSFAAAFFAGVLTCYHVYLIATNQTAYENFRQLYGSTRNPFDKGVVNNIKEILFSPWTPSRINFRSELHSLDQLEHLREP